MLLRLFGRQNQVLLSPCWRGRQYIVLLLLLHLLNLWVLHLLLRLWLLILIELPPSIILLLSVVSTWKLLRSRRISRKIATSTSVI